LTLKLLNWLVSILKQDCLDLVQLMNSWNAMFYNLGNRDGFGDGGAKRT
jgi:hypothetical protein